MKYFLVIINLILLGVFVSFQNKKIPENFVYAEQVIPNIEVDMRYAGTNNFIGKPVEGYQKQKAILTKPAAEALKKVQAELEAKGYSLKIFDAYRPQRAINQFKKWAADPVDTTMKAFYYPEVQKKDLFNLGYLSSRSGHSRGSTIDLTLVDKKTGKEVDMGGAYDYFGEISSHNYPHITTQQIKNRELLKSIMGKFGFRPYTKEWWHYTLRQEPFPDTYFDFVIE